MDHEKTKNCIPWIIAGSGVLGAGACCYRLFLRQAVAFEGPYGNYPSDLIVHISTGRDGSGYSILEIIYRVLLNGLHFNEKSVAVLLSLSVAACIIASAFFMRRFSEVLPGWALCILAEACVFAMAIYIPAIHAQRYLGVQSGSNWHNDTYTVMRLGGVLVLCCFFDLREKYLAHISIREQFVFFVLLFITNWIKPNFVLAFGPAMLVVLLADFIRDRGKSFWQQVKFGLPVLFSGIVLIFQERALFSGDEEVAASVDEFPIGISLAYNLRLRTAHPVISILQSAAFPLTVLFLFRRKLKTDRRFSFVWLMWLTGLCEYLFLHENGIRKNDGNLSWGYSFCLYIVFITAAAVFFDSIVRELREKQLSSPAAVMRDFRNASAKEKALYLCCAAAVVLFILHLVSGLVFFWYLFLGRQYAM